MTFYLKYRPQKVSELDLVRVRETLTQLLSKKELPHAFLFTGPRGTGKTSSARILAKAINCENKEKDSIEPCNECDTCRAITKGTHIDVIEMDAASNRGIDEIRALKQDIMLAPTLSKKKVYIIDEVHMLTTEAANALLKTLEEPPSHVVFILATTDPQKLPQTVISRLSVVQFYKASEEEVTKKLMLIAENEKLTVENGVYKTIATLADGSFRDAVKLLEEFSLKSSTITAATVESVNYSGSNQSAGLLNKLTEKDCTNAIAFVRELSSQGIEGKSFLNTFISQVHQELLKSVGVHHETKAILNQTEAVSLLELLLEAKARLMYSTNDFLPLEIALVKFKPIGSQEPSKKVQPLPQTETSSKPPQIIPEVKVLPTTEVPKTDSPEVLTEKTDVVETSATPFTSKDLVDIDTWGKILVLMREKNASVEALLRATTPRAFDGTNLHLGVYFKFHKERLELPANKILLEEVLTGVFGGLVHVMLVLEDPPPKPQEELGLTQSSAPDIMKAAKEIFG